MTRIRSERRARAVALAALVLALGATALVMGAAPAHAGYPCSDEPFLTKDVWNEAGNDYYVGVDRYSNGLNGDNGAWVCWSTTGEANQTFFVARVRPMVGAKNGVTADLGACRPPVAGVSSEPFEWSTCGNPAFVARTGAEVGTPGPSSDAPGDANGTTGGGLDGGSGTCVYLNSATPTCLGAGVPIASVTLAEGDLPKHTLTPNGCLGSPCVVPLYDAAVEVGDSGSDTATVTVLGITLPGIDVPYECEHVGSGC